MSGENEAYNLERFQPREPRLVAMQNNVRVQKDKHKRQRRQAVLNVVVYLVLALIVMGMVGFFITCNVRLTEMNRTISEYQTQLGTLQSERVRLEAELASKTSAEQMELYAQSNGMLPAESSQIYYIPAAAEDLVTVPKGQFGWLYDVWTGLCGFFS